jgi:hypothetical protein
MPAAVRRPPDAARQPCHGRSGKIPLHLPTQPPRPASSYTITTECSFSLTPTRVSVSELAWPLFVASSTNTFAECEWSTTARVRCVSSIRTPSRPSRNSRSPPQPTLTQTQAASASLMTHHSTKYSGMNWCCGFPEWRIIAANRFASLRDELGIRCVVPGAKV